MISWFSTSTSSFSFSLSFSLSPSPFLLPLSFPSFFLLPFILSRCLVWGGGGVKGGGGIFSIWLLIKASKVIRNSTIWDEGPPFFPWILVQCDRTDELQHPRGVWGQDQRRLTVFIRTAAFKSWKLMRAKNNHRAPWIPMEWTSVSPGAFTLRTQPRKGEICMLSEKVLASGLERTNSDKRLS